jgi:hypothetical protein
VEFAGTLNGKISSGNGSTGATLRVDLAALDDALKTLAEMNEQQSRVV